MILLAVTFLLAVDPPGEDAAHRADRRRTEQLNRAAARATAGGGRGADAALARYDAAGARYARQLAEWRRRVADCERGDYDACDPR